MRRDAGEKLLHRERLRDVVVRAQLEAEQLVALLDARREHEDRNPARLLVLLQLAADREAVHVGQVQVEDDEVRRADEELVDRDEAAGVALDLVAPVLLEVVREREGEIVVVLHDGDPLPRGARGAGGGVAGGGARRLRRSSPNLPVM